ncbi:unnamed protein product, partial [Cyprideis torosa]
MTLLLGILIPLLHLLGTLSAIHAVGHVRSSQGAIAWALSLMIMPYLVLPFYWIFGRNRFYGYVEVLRKLQEGQDHEVPFPRLLQSIDPFKSEPPEERHNNFAVLARIKGSAFTQGNSLQLLIDGAATFQAIFDVIDQAKDYLLIQFFIIKDDAVGQELLTRLTEKSRQGVSVRVLYDEVGSHGLGRNYLHSLREAGVDVRAFGSTRGFRNRFQLNFRNHRKIVIVDGQIGFVGGLNVGEEYLGKGPLGHWRDTHLQVQGPAVQALQHTFASDWYWACRQTLALEWQPVPAGDHTVLIHATGPADTLEACSMFFHQTIIGARQRLWIASPYFVPSDPIFEALQLAALRGVDVRILLPAKPDQKLVYLASFSFLQ